MVLSVQQEQPGAGEVAAFGNDQGLGRGDEVGVVSGIAHLVDAGSQPCDRTAGHRRPFAVGGEAVLHRPVGAGQGSIIPAPAGLIGVSNSGGTAAGGNLYRGGLAGRRGLTGGEAHQKLLPGEAGHVQGASTGRPGLAAVYGAVHAHGGADHFNIGVQQNGRLLPTGRDGELCGLAGKLVGCGGFPDKELLPG